MEIAFLGFGLIAGSIARAVRTRGTIEERRGDRLVAWSPTGAGARAALADGVIDTVVGSPGDAVASADLVIIAAPPLEAIALLDILADPAAARLRPSTVVTDVTSTKARIVERAAALGLPFVGGHPMAGRETTGYASSREDLFVDRPWVIVTGGTTTDTATTAMAARVAVVEELARRVGARPVRMDAAEHDAAVAAVSHLPLVLAAALVEAVAGDPDRGERAGWPIARSLAATGWRDMTRLARGDESMGAGILATNADAIVEQIRAVRDVLDRWIAELDGPGGPDAERLHSRLRSARRRLDDHPS